MAIKYKLVFFLVLSISFFACKGNKEVVPLDFIGKEVVSRNDKVPATTIYNFVEGKNASRPETERLDDDAGIMRYKENLNGLILYYSIYRELPDDYGKEVWDKSFELASKRVKLLTPAIYSDSDKKFVKCIHKEYTIFMLVEENGTNAHGILANNDTNDHILSFECSGLAGSTEYDLLFATVFSFHGRIKSD